MAYAWLDVVELPPIYLFDAHQFDLAVKYADNFGQAVCLCTPYLLEGQHQKGLIIGHMIDRLRKRCENFKNMINCQRMILLEFGDYYLFPIRLEFFTKYLDTKKTDLLTPYDHNIHSLENPEIVEAVQKWLLPLPSSLKP